MPEFGRAPFLGARLLQQAAAYFAIDNPEDLRDSRKRARDLVLSRWSFITVMLDETPCSERWVGRFLGKHHSSINHAYNSARALRESDPLFRHAVEHLRETLQ